MVNTIECPLDPFQQEDLENTVKMELPWMELDSKTVFITGSTGLVGSQLVKTLLAANRIRGLHIRVIAMARSLEKAKRVFGSLLQNTSLQLYFGNVERRIELSEPIDFIIHAASQTVSKEFVQHPVETIDTSFVGTKNVLELAREKSCRSMVYISSMEAYGNSIHGKDKTTESDLGYIDNLNVRSCYSEGKRFCECLCACYHSEHNVPVKIARLAQTFGAGVSCEDNRVFAQFAKSVINGTDIILHTKGQSYGNYCYTADAVSGILTVLLCGENANAYNVVSEKTTMKIAEMANMVAHEIAGDSIRVVFDIPESALTYGYAPDVTLCLSGEKLRALGWAPVVAADLPTMYRRLIASFQAQYEQRKK